MVSTIKTFLAGKKTYVTAVIALVVAVMAWATDEITGPALLVAIYAALQTIFIRAGVAKIAKDTVDLVEKQDQDYE